MVKIPLATFEKVLKESKKGIRVSQGATEEFVQLIREIAEEMASEATELASHAGRKTVMREDIKLAGKRFWKYR